MNILIVDDQPERHEGFIKILQGHQLTHAWTYSQAIDAMRDNTFDMICLDHDLGDLHFGQKCVQVESLNFKLSYTPDYYEAGMYQSGRTYYDGRDICTWIVDHCKNLPKKILIHSWNLDGACEMEARLQSLPGIEIVRKQFGR